jgi:hypothetical protein
MEIQLKLHGEKTHLAPWMESKADEDRMSPCKHINYESLRPLGTTFYLAERRPL